jgi:hypothetical protein
MSPHKQSDVETEDNKMDAKEHEAGGAKEPTPDPTEVPGEQIGGKAEETTAKASPAGAIYLIAQPETKAQDNKNQATGNNLEQLKTHLSLVSDELHENIQEAIAHNAADASALVVGTAIGLNFIRTGQTSEALCTAGVVLTMVGSRFLTEGAVMQYYRNTYRRSTPRMKEGGSPLASIVLGMAGVGAGCCYLAGLFTSSSK